MRASVPPVLSCLSAALPGILFLGVLTGCWPGFPGDTGGGAPLFTLLDARRTGITFENTVTPTDSMHLLSYEYLYNGGGVGVGDFNRDGLPDLVFTGNMVDSRLYLNAGDLRFTDATAPSGFSTAGRWCTGVTVVDINHDGYDDIYVAVGGPGGQSNHPNLLFVNQQDATFREAAAEYGLDHPGESNHAVFLDFDRDGDLDMYLLNGGGFERSAVTLRPILSDGSARNTDVLFENNFSDALGHPVFTDVSARAGIAFEGFGLGVGVIDVNHDGWPDIYVSNDYLSRDLLYVNQQDGTFQEQAADYFAHGSFFSMGNAVGDIDNDGYPDLVTLDMLPEDHFRRMTMFGPNQHARFQRAVSLGYGHQYMRNMLQLGSHPGPFREVGQLAGIDRTDWSWCPLLADFDHDGLQDLYVTNGYGKNITDLDFVKFREESVDPFSRPEDVRDALRESLDELPAIVLPNYAYRNEGRVSFTPATESWGLSHPSISNGAVYADLDLDGDLEIVTNNLNAPPFVYRSNLSEQRPAGAGYLQVELAGSPRNPAGIGARVEAFAGTGTQNRYQQPAGGFQSSLSTVLHFGFATDTLVDSLRVTWPDGRRSVLYDVSLNRRVKVDYAGSHPATAPVAAPPQMLKRFDEPLPFAHREVIDPSDFAVQPLLQHAFTRQGPGVAVGDVNGDGREDLFLGGAYGSDAGILTQQGDGTFLAQELPTADYEDLGALLVDVDNDHDLDLYVSSGGTERHAASPQYQDRIYLNDGRGAFTRAEGWLPSMISSTATVAGGDLDRDGGIDLFVGGRTVPGQYPTPPRSYLLRNTGNGFEDVTAALCPALERVGMVTSAVWTDFNNDDLPDLIVVGEWMQIRAFVNTGAGLEEVTGAFGLSQTSGMWNSITPADLDDDGDTDYIVGNIGENTPYNVSGRFPLRLHYGDFDRNGTTDPILSQYEEGKYYPVAPFDQLATQLPGIRKSILHYRDYANATTVDILSRFDTSGMHTLECELQSSVILENRGGAGFVVRPLPREAQYAPVLGVVADDLNGDGDMDLLLVGSDHHREVIAGNLDASSGTLLRNEGGLNFRPVDAARSGLSTTGDTRAVVRLPRGSHGDLIAVTRNAATPEAYVLPVSEAGQVVTFRPGEVYARVELADGRQRRIENTRGGGYLTQSSPTFRVPARTVMVTFHDAFGRTTRSLTPSPETLSR